MKDEEVHKPDYLVTSLKSPWHTKPQPGHWYEASTEFAVARLKGSGKCLVIGSPLFEAEALKSSWDVTYLDVRKPPIEINFVQGDATAMPFPEGSFDAVSSSCVMSHAGLGRYGDALEDNGDEMMLREIKRVLKPNALAAVTFGCVVDAERPVRIGNMHRVYTITEAERLADLVGLQIQEIKVWGTLKHEWVGTPTKDFLEPDYLSVLLKNVAVAEQG